MKKLVVLLCMFFPLAVCAQEVKIAFVNSQEVLSALPELSDVETKMATLRDQYQREFKTMQDDYQKKYSDFMTQQDSLTENIKLRRQQEIEDLGQRLQNYVPVAEQDIQKKQEELYAPLIEKIQKAIKQVGDEKGYTYIINPQILLYTGSSAVDATPFVKAKLGIK
ncbi:MAG: OmpH family outer membrane protein [Tannerella sp.]|nr:OmpH family outer membrane protein [Tannerella sp.]